MADGPETPDKNSVPHQLAKADAPPQPADKLDEEAREVGLSRKRSDLTLSRWVGYGTLGLMGAQVLIMDAGFFVYGNANHWHISAGVVAAWLAAGVIQVIGSVLLVVASHLFPGGGENDS
jgi:hypothetical protein